MIRNRYAETASRLANRYRDSSGRLVTHISGKPTRYAILEDIAAVKYLGCDPTKLPNLRRPDGGLIAAAETINDRPRHIG